MLVGLDETEGAWRGVNILGNKAVLKDFLQHYDYVLPLVLGLDKQVQPLFVGTSSRVKIRWKKRQRWWRC